MSKRGMKVHDAVLAVLRRHGAPLSAYDLLAALREGNPKIAPPTIYRALAVLMEQGRVQRLESLKAYIACPKGRDSAASILSICDDCGFVEQSAAPDLLEELSSVLGRSGFSPVRHVIEVHGVCAACGDGRAAR